MSTIQWKTAIEFEDITYKKCDGVARIAFNRPEVRNAFRPQTTRQKSPIGEFMHYLPRISPTLNRQRSNSN